MAFLDSIFGPLLELSSFWTILVLALIVTLISTLAYKFLTDQKLMKKLKEEIKEIQKEVNELRHHPEKALKSQQRMMEVNMKMMKQQFKPILFTIIPFILIFGWMRAHVAYEPILPDTEFNVSMTMKPEAGGNVEIIVPEGIELESKESQEIMIRKKPGSWFNEQEGIVSWTMKGEPGEYLIEFKYGSQKYSRELLITEEKEYKEPVHNVNIGSVKTIEISNDPVLVNFFVTKLNWFWSYFIFSIIFSISLRKLLKIH